ncbi:hypothetical protein RN629_11195 [Sphingomonadaceae bacterium jetA1]|jgi:hypothetical protein|uniref:hypothetical protein n=1 Tax=Facivitalis istanbulensis TaxID=3075838 RepID=UPI003483CBD5
MNIDVDQQRQAFGHWLRTGRLATVRLADGTELKFNPYHDPRNGQFTFAPGGALGSGGISAQYANVRPRGSDTLAPRMTIDRQTGARRASTYPNPPTIGQHIEAQLAAPLQRPIVGRGGNIRAFEDPMTLEQSFPGLRNSPGGAVVAVADNFFDLTGPADAMTAEVLQNQMQQLSAQIKAIDPGWHYDEIVPTDALGNRVETTQGLTAKLSNLRFQRAAVTARVKGDYGPLQVETLRFVQRNADAAYDQGVALLKAGRLTPRLSDQEALGNYVDRQVRRSLRERYHQSGIDSTGAGPVRVNRRENISSGGDLTYRRPDARVKDVVFDVTLSRKTMGTPQVRGFFDADFRPSRVVIIRPRQLGAGHTYAIPRPETKR